ncbi:MAG: hypothetical protein ACOYYS_27190 [Chloroflexota bacterium]
MSEQEFEFIPFHAINEFMRNDYRLAVVRAALNAAPDLPDTFRKPIEQAVKRHVKVPGFRNPEKAPAAIKAFPMAKAFEKNPDVVAAVIAAWAESRPELRQRVSDLLKERGWQFFPEEISLESLSPDKIKEWGILPLSVDRTHLPGFVTAWPKDNDFEVLYDAFTQTYPDVDESIDNVSLMVVWLVMRLPMDVDGMEEEADDDLEKNTPNDPNEEA